MKTFISLSLILALLSLTACEKDSSLNSVSPNPKPVNVDTWMPLQLGDKSIEIQIAITQSEQQKGLMFRTELGQDQGMLFPYPKPQRLSFWMKNTLIPLDIGFFDSNGILLEVHKMYPKDTRSVPSTSQSAQFALEMNQGWFLKNQINPGTQLNTALLSNALHLRGARMSDYSF